MILDVNGTPAYAYTGGKAFDAARPTVVFIHGAEHDHSVWALQTRYFAHHGFGVLALDLPGHGRSAGPPLRDRRGDGRLAARRARRGAGRPRGARRPQHGLADRARCRRALPGARRETRARCHRRADDRLRRAARRRPRTRAAGHRHGQPVVAFDDRREAVEPRARLLAARHEPAPDGARLRARRRPALPYRFQRLQRVRRRPRTRGGGALPGARHLWAARHDDAAESRSRGRQRDVASGRRRSTRSRSTPATR